MAAMSKVIDKTVLSENEAIALTELALLIQQQHTQIAQLTDGLKANKARLTEVSMRVFKADLDKDIPEVNGNHEFHTDSGTVTVNYKIPATAHTPKEIKGRPASEVLRERFGTSTDELFEIGDTVEVLTDERVLRTQAREHPELFRISLKEELTHQQLMQLVAAHPSMLTVQVTDPQQYARIYPDHVNKTPTVSFKAGFLETLGKLDNVIKRAVKGLLRVMLPEVVQTAVVVGNRSKK